VEDFRRLHHLQDIGECLSRYMSIWTRRQPTRRPAGDWVRRAAAAGLHHGMGRRQAGPGGVATLRAGHHNHNPAPNHAPDPTPIYNPDPDPSPSAQVMHPRRQLAETPTARTFQHTRRRFGGQLQRRHQSLYFGPTRQGGRDLPAGLANLGNTCYINAALQARLRAATSQLQPT